MLFDKDLLKKNPSFRFKKVNHIRAKREGSLYLKSRSYELAWGTLVNLQACQEPERQGCALNPRVWVKRRDQHLQLYTARSHPAAGLVTPLHKPLLTNEGADRMVGLQEAWSMRDGWKKWKCLGGKETTWGNIMSTLIPEGLSYGIDLFLCCSREQEEDEAAGGMTPLAAGEITAKRPTADPLRTWKQFQTGRSWSSGHLMWFFFSLQP